MADHCHQVAVRERQTDRERGLTEVDGGGKRDELAVIGAVTRQLAIETTSGSWGSRMWWTSGAR
jgi:hypothetical protein